jgi:hypothetical protein
MEKVNRENHILLGGRRATGEVGRYVVAL